MTIELRIQRFLREENTYLIIVKKDGKKLKGGGKMSKTKIKDIYNGKTITVWEDGDFIFMSFPWTTLNLPLDEWKNIKKELKEIGSTK